MATQIRSVDDEAPVAGLRLTVQLAQSQGDISSMLTEQQLSTLGADVVADYERDLGDRQEWEDEAREGLKKAAQEKREAKDYPFSRAANVDYPLLAIAAMQFNARAYPAICKSGNIVRCKVIGSDKGRPQFQDTPQGRIPLVTFMGKPMLLPEAQQMVQQLQAQQPQQAPSPDGQAPAAPQIPQPQPLWQIPPGAKTKRAGRVSDYLNIYVEFRMDDWEEDTDQMLFEIPIVGCGFRKLWWANDKQKAAYVSALDLIVPSSAKSLKTTPRITERMPDVFPYQIRQRIGAGEYRDVVLPAEGEDSEAPRLLLEQHRLMDLDLDGVDEPYIVTVDKETAQVFKVEANFGPDDVHLSGNGVKHIEKNRFFIKYPFLPNPKGSFYNIGFAHLLSQIGPVVNTAINQMIDAGHAQIAGGGFIASGIRLQGNGQTNTLRWQPGEYKYVNVAASDLRAGIVERTFPNLSPVMFQILEMMLGAAKEITSVKDVVTGEAPNTAPVGTTLALIEQGLTVFTAIYKRIYRSLGEEFGLIYENLSQYGGEEVAADYLNVLDDIDADFKKDFAEADMDIKPVADPSTVTNMQRIAKAQLLDGMRGKGLNDSVINRRILEAADVEDIDELMPPENAPPPPELVAKLRQMTSAADLNDARAAHAQVEATQASINVGKSLAGSDT